LIDCVEKYIKKTELFKLLKKDFVYVMDLPEVIRTNQLLNLLTTMLPVFSEKEPVDKTCFEKIFVYAISWSFGGLFEQEDREKFHKYLESRNAPLPQINVARSAMDKETIYDYQFDEKTRAWKLWEAENWVAPKKILFNQLLIPTADSTRAEYLI
jgi:hypothetical protein